jgi:hypothetical protein
VHATPRCVRNAASKRFLLVIEGSVLFAEGLALFDEGKFD